RGVIYAPSWVGTRDGGAFEDPSMIVAEVDASHRIRRFDQYGVDQLDEARARFAAIESGFAPDGPALLNFAPSWASEAASSRGTGSGSHIVQGGWHGARGRDGFGRSDGLADPGGHRSGDRRGGEGADAWAGPRRVVRDHPAGHRRIVGG